MDRIVSYLPAVVASAFACGVAYAFGWTIGLGYPEILRFLTFSDFVDNSIPAIAFYGVVLLFAFVGEGPRLGDVADIPQTRVSAKRLVALLVFILAIVGTITVLVWRGILPARFLIAACLLSVALLGVEAYLDFMTKGVDRTTKVWLQRFIAAILFMVVWGYGAGLPSSDTYEYRVLTDKGSISASTALPIDRGMLVIGKTGFQLVPWEKVLKVEHLPALAQDKSNSGQKAK